MGMLINGVWHTDIDRTQDDGAFRREPSALPALPAARLAKRFSEKPTPLLVASLSCPWSHRATLTRAVKDLRSIPLTVAGGPRVEGYAVTGANPPNVGVAPVRHVHQLYRATDARYTGRATVPLLWDADAQVILSNDSATIARALDMLGPDWRLAPDEQASEIDALNARNYDGLANAVYRAGFSTSQEAYRAAVADVYATLDRLEDVLTHQRCLFGAQVTEADLFLFATLVRFDAVYVPLFRCTRRRLVDYPALWAYARDVYTWPGVARTVNFRANLQGYFLNDTDNNPHGIVPEVPETDWSTPHGREAFGPLTVWQNGLQEPFDAIARLAHAG
ncbi:MAG: glutathione S-transferase C-terminal domain-containing protein [Pseudomonadota bacterium]